MDRKSIFNSGILQVSEFIVSIVFLTFRMAKELHTLSTAEKARVSNLSIRTLNSTAINSSLTILVALLQQPVRLY